MLANNVKLLGQMIGNIFLPIVAKVLPYINGLVIALQRFFQWLAKILGIDLEGLMGKNPTPDNSGLSDLLDDAEDLTGALDDDTASAKKLKKQLQGFDALNNLTTNEDKTAGLDPTLASGLLNDAFLDAVEDYLKAWQDAFDKINDKARRIADQIARFFKRLAKPVFEAWKKVGAKVVQQWKNAGYNLKLLFQQIGKDFWRVWEDDKTTKIFEDIFSIFGNLGEVVQHLANRFREAWVANDNGFKILSAIRDIIGHVADRARAMSESIVNWAKNLNFKPLLGKMVDFFEALSPVVRTLMNILKDFLDEVLLPLAKWTIEKGLPDLIQVFTDMLKEVKWAELRKNLYELWQHLKPFAKKIGEGLIIFLKRIAKAVTKFVNSDKFKDFLKKIGQWMDTVTAEDIADFFETLAKVLVGLKIAVYAWGFVAPALKVLGSFVKILGALGKFGLGFIKLAGRIIFYLSDVGLAGAFANFGKAVGKFAGKLGSGIGKIIGGMKKLAPAIKSGWAGASSALGSIGSFLTTDIGALVSTGSIANIGAVIGTALIGGVISALAGFKLGKWIGEHWFEEDASYYQNFKWTGEGGFFDSVDYFIHEILPPKMEELKLKVALGFLSAGQAIAEQKNAWASNIEGLKVMLGAKLLGIASDFVTFKERVHNAVQEAKNKVGTTLGEWVLKFIEWKENLKTSIFNADVWELIFASIKAGATLAWNNLVMWWNNTVVAKLNSWVQSVKNKVGEIKQYFADLRREANKDWSFNIQMPWNRSSGGGHARIYANGGFPEDGMFFANHNELVGKFTNGQTAVANNEQIVSGIQNGVYGAMSESNSLLIQQNELLQAILEKETGINANDIFRSVQRSASSYTKQTGRSAFA